MVSKELASRRKKQPEPSTRRGSESVSLQVSSAGELTLVQKKLAIEAFGVSDFHVHVPMVFALHGIVPKPRLDHYQKLWSSVKVLLHHGLIPTREAERALKRIKRAMLEEVTASC